MILSLFFAVICSICIGFFLHWGCFLAQTKLTPMEGTDLFQKKPTTTLSSEWVCCGYFSLCSFCLDSSFPLLLSFPFFLYHFLFVEQLYQHIYICEQRTVTQNNMPPPRPVLGDNKGIWTLMQIQKLSGLTPKSCCVVLCNCLLCKTVCLQNAPFTALTRQMNTNKA